MQSDAGIAISAPVTTTIAGVTSLITTLATVSDVTDKGKPKPKKTTHVGNGTDNGGGAIGAGGLVMGLGVVVAVGVAEKIV